LKGLLRLRGPLLRQTVVIFIAFIMSGKVARENIRARCYSTRKFTLT